jgi:ABC-2 type transport system permease protein
MRVRALILRILRQFIRDKRTLALMLIAPMFILLLMSLVFDGEDYVPDLAAVDLPSPLLEALRQQEADVDVMELADAEDKYRC